MKPDAPLVQLVIKKNAKTSCYEIITFAAGRVSDRFVGLDSAHAMMKLEELVPMLVPVG
jgi:hypothetical protein